MHDFLLYVFRNLAKTHLHKSEQILFFRLGYRLIPVVMLMIKTHKTSSLMIVHPSPLSAFSCDEEYRPSMTMISPLPLSLYEHGHIFFLQRDRSGRLCPCK